MIAGKDDFWVSEDGTRYEVGDVIPVLNMRGVKVFNETIVMGTCDMCDWRIIGPTCLIQSFSTMHVQTHIMAELDDAMRDDFRHPDFTE